MVNLSLILEYYRPLLLQIFLLLYLFFSFWYFNYMYIMHFETVSEFLDILDLYFLKNLFLFTFKFGKFPLTYIQTHLFFSGYRQSTNEPIKSIFHFRYSVLVSNVSFWFFLQVSLSLFIAHLLLHISPFPIRALNI